MQPNRGQVRAGQNRVRVKPYQGKAQRDKRIVDCEHHHGAEPCQVGRGGTPLPYLSVADEFFSNKKRVKRAKYYQRM